MNNKNRGILYFLAINAIYLSLFMFFILLDELRRIIFHISFYELHIAIEIEALLAFIIAITLVLLFVKITGRINPLSPEYFRVNRKFYSSIVIFLVSANLIVWIYKIIFQDIYFGGHKMDMDSPVLKLLQQYYERTGILFRSDYTDYSPIGFVITFLRIVFIGPFIEEVVFRGIMLNGLLKKYPVWFAILFQTVLFALSHIYYFGLSKLSVFIMGIFFGFLAYYYRSIVPALLMHIVINMSAVIIPILYSLKIMHWGKYNVTNAFIEIAIIAGSILITGTAYHIYFRIVDRKRKVEIETISFRDRIRGLFRRVPDGYFSPDGAE